MASCYYKIRYVPTHSRKRKVRPKTFKTEGAAKAYAEEKKLKEFKIVNMRNTDSSHGKYKIIQ